MNAYIVTEGQSDVDILRKLLPEEIAQQVSIIGRNGRSSAISTAAGIMIDKRKPVALVLDSDTEDQRNINAQLSTLNYLLRQALAGNTFKVILAIPEIETIFAQDRSLLSKIVGKQVEEMEWEYAKSQPKKYFKKLLSDSPQWLYEILNKLTEEDIQILQQHELLVSLSQFLTESCMAATI
ncbi:hypothetical protein [Pseudanabaena sp. PCC 6802]|uniref:hypothetical protein n=1 Tax=Pseudanabaena sp. PCC 6802 TaxID=118173 RepID=UPI0003694C7D|nr:hypothetical protein [Pseudanabaena sp. PCC 6802]